MDHDLAMRLSSGVFHGLRGGLRAASPVLCVPGLSANARSFDAIAETLARRGNDVVAFDLRGRGLSPAGEPGSHGWRRHAEDVLEAARTLGFGSFDLVGHSMGAFVAMQAAALQGSSIRRLVLIDAAGIPEPEVIPPILAALERLDIVYGSREEYLAKIESRGAAVPWDELWKRHYLYELEDVPGGVRPRTSKAAVVEDAVYGSKHDAKEFWGSLRMPTLLVRASQRLLGTGFVLGAPLRDAFLAAVPSARAVEVDANHYGVMAHPDALRAIADFLSG